MNKYEFNWNEFSKEDFVDSQTTYNFAVTITAGKEES